LNSATNLEKTKTMTLKNALNYFKNLVSKASKKSEIKVYQEFIRIITELEKRDLSETEIHSLETTLDTLGLNSANTNHKKHFNKALKRFKKYLRDAFSLTTKGYYTNIGIALGSSFGILFGIVFLSSFERSLGITLGILIGMVTGLIIGRNLDAEAEASGKTV